MKCSRPFAGPIELALYEVEALRAESGIWLFCMPSGAAQVGGFGVVNPVIKAFTKLRKISKEFKRNRLNRKKNPVEVNIKGAVSRSLSKLKR